MTLCLFRLAAVHGVRTIRTSWISTLTAVSSSTTRKTCSGTDGGGDAEEEPNIKEHLGTGDKYDKMYKATGPHDGLPVQMREGNACRQES